MEGFTLKLTVQQGPKQGETIDCKMGSVVKIGRVLKGNTFAIKDSGISSNHLLIEFKNGKWVISDLDSSNGTILNESKLRALTDFDLRDEDVIKIGEWTSLKVNIVEEIKATIKESRNISKNGVVNVEIADEIESENREKPQLRRNPRRRAAPKVSAKQNLGFEVGSTVAESRPKRGKPKKVKNEESVEIQEISENLELGQEISKQENVIPGEKKRTRRGASRRPKVSKDEPVPAPVVVEITEDAIAEPVNCTEQVSNVVAERTRVSNKDEQPPSESVLEIQKVLQNLNFEQNLGLQKGEEPEYVAPIEKKPTRRVAQRRGKASKDETTLVSVQVPVFEEAPTENCYKPKESNLQEDRLSKESASTSYGDAKENFVPENDQKLGYGIDWEKMTLGEWFDYMEICLPKKLHKITDEIISSMRDRSKQFNEFILPQQQLEGKGKLPLV